MAWRPTQHIIEGELENTTPGKVSGWFRFAGIRERITLDLKGEFHRDIRGARLRVRGKGELPDAAGSMKGIALHQTADAGDITAGLYPYDYGRDPYIEWYSTDNGRVVLEPGPEDIEVAGTPISPDQTRPIDRRIQEGLMAGWLTKLSRSLGVPAMSMSGSGEGITPETYSHWVVAPDGKVVGEARPMGRIDSELATAAVRILPHGPSVSLAAIPTAYLRRKAPVSLN